MHFNHLVWGEIIHVASPNIQVFSSFKTQQLQVAWNDRNAMDLLKNGMTGKAGFHPVLTTWLHTQAIFAHPSPNRNKKGQVASSPYMSNIKTPICAGISDCFIMIQYEEFSHQRMLRTGKECKPVFLVPNVAPNKNIQSNPHSGPIASSSNNWTRHDNTYRKLPLQSRPISHQPSLPAAQWHVFLAADVSGQWVPISRSGDSIFNLTCYWTKHFELEDLHCPRGTLEGLRLAKKSPRLSQDLHTLSGKCWDDLSVKPWEFDRNNLGSFNELSQGQKDVQKLGKRSRDNKHWV